MKRLSPLLLAALAACRGGETVPAPRPAPAAAPPAEVAVPDEPAPADAVHGELTEKNGQTMLRVWGTPQEMGYAHGFLLRERIIDVVEHYALDALPPTVVNTAAAIYPKVADVSESLREETEAIIAGMKAAGGAEIERLDRELTAEDLLVLNAMTDLLAIGCSSVSAWGSATQNAEELGPGVSVVRNLDWSDDPDLLRNHLLIAYAPSDPKRQPFVSVAFAGYIGCLSCMNEAGVTVLFNMGYGEGAASITGAMAGFAPANLLLRDAVERRDVDTADAVEAAVKAKTHAGSYIVHVLEPAKVAAEHDRAPARILEVEADGVHVRAPDASTPLGPELLAATNHLRGKTGPESCRRYDRIERKLADDHKVTRAKLWTLARNVRLDAVVHSMLVRPDARTLDVWLRRPGDPPRADVEPTRYARPDLWKN